MSRTVTLFGFLTIMALFICSHVASAAPLSEVVSIERRLVTIEDANVSLDRNGAQVGIGSVDVSINQPPTDDA
ncbi:hypothetical protein BDF20DRAFT_883884 [Mycotypha africana]|uniref:uncharacterized protein n=1 Tax=Mycotypha africana TaxID=64632 RepID=UPI00230094B5|nr:uncharacterized protein BDF20DRAFT_883884 [Mycotypha africana]KAI8973743.1 hypothetical protein BDF20DRAFT_883884 [Mycotypha africana]